jgi:hypothetical protein
LENYPVLQSHLYSLTSDTHVGAMSKTITTDLNDFFRDVRNKGHLEKSEKYWVVVNAVWSNMKTTHPQTFKTIEPLLDAYRNNTNPVYDVLFGNVQSGKSKAITMIAWYCCYVIGNMIPAILTIDLSCVRTDFMGKAENMRTKDIEPVIKQQFHNYDATAQAKLTDYFCLKMKTHSDTKSSKTTTEPDIGTVFCYLQQKDNIKSLICEYKKHQKTMIVIVDEVQKMYTEKMRKKSDTHEQLMDPETTNHHLMFWLYKKCIDHKIHLLGVTATPVCALTDIDCYPKKVVELGLDAPCEQMEYYGNFMKDEGNSAVVEQKENKMVRLHHHGDDSYSSILKRISKRDHTPQKGETEIKVVLITTERDNLPQETIKEELSAIPHVLSYCFNQTTSKKMTLEDIWNDVETKLNENVCKVGAIVIIGKNSFSAGVSVKPPPPKNKISITIRGMTYVVNGVTDQIYKISDQPSMETTLQAMRLFGWYPTNHQSHLHIVGSLKNREKDIAFMRSIVSTNREIVKQYKTDPRSLRIIVTNVRNFYNGNPYKSESYHFKISTNQSLEHKHKHNQETYIGTTIVKISDAIDMKKISSDIDLTKPFTTYGGNDQYQRKLKTPLKEYLKTMHGINNRFQCPWSVARHDEIIKNCIHPGKGSTWQVNAFLTGEHGAETPINRAVLVIFDLQWEDRLDLVINSEQERHTFKSGENQWITVFSQQQFALEHKYLDLMTERDGKFVRIDELKYDRLLSHFETIMPKIKATKKITSKNKKVGRTIKNPLSGKMITYGLKTFKDLLKTHDYCEDTNTFTLK